MDNRTTLNFRPLPCLCVWLLFWFCLPAGAKDLTAYRIGDTAESDIITPVALDVVDPIATATLQSAKAIEFPAIFRSITPNTNAVARDFNSKFTLARSNFLNAVSSQFHQQTLDDSAIAGADFGRLITAFGRKHKDFPVTDELAAQWALGGTGETTRVKFLGALEQAVSGRIRPDELPHGMALGEIVRLVPVTRANEDLSLPSAQHGQLIAAASLTPLSVAQTQFCAKFPADEQVLARAIAKRIKPNCIPDAPLTLSTRGSAVSQLVVVNHFDAGSAIVHQGETVDARAKSAFLALADKLKSLPAAMADNIAVTHPVTTPITPASPPPQPDVKAEAPEKPIALTTTPSPAPAVPHLGLIAALAGISVCGLLLAGWQYLRERRRSRSQSLMIIQSPLPFANVEQAMLAPQVTQAVREAVQQELASQRRELLMAQQAATDEIASLIKRLDELQVPLQERLHAYQTRIQVLEQELAQRDEENRELLKAKLEMMRHQLAAEQETVTRTATA